MTITVLEAIASSSGKNHSLPMKFWVVEEISPKRRVVVRRFARYVHMWCDVFLLPLSSVGCHCPSQSERVLKFKNGWTTINKFYRYFQTDPSYSHTESDNVTSCFRLAAKCNSILHKTCQVCIDINSPATVWRKMRIMAYGTCASTFKLTVTASRSALPFGGRLVVIYWSLSL